MRDRSDRLQFSCEKVKAIAEGERMSPLQTNLHTGEMCEESSPLHPTNHACD